VSFKQRDKCKVTGRKVNGFRQARRSCPLWVKSRHCTGQM
jgi:hypothetical protein